MDDLTDCYQILGLQPDASPDEVKQAYRDLAYVWHPDRFLNNPRLQQKANERMKEINQAYEMLKDVVVHHSYTKSEEEPYSYRSYNEHDEPFDPSKRILCSDGVCIGIINAKGFCNICGKPYRPDSQGNYHGGQHGAYWDDTYGEPFDPSKRILCSDGVCIGVIDKRGFCSICGRPYKPESQAVHFRHKKDG